MKINIAKLLTSPIARRVVSTVATIVAAAIADKMVKLGDDVARRTKGAG